MVRQDTSIAGTEINKQKHVISLFADDIIIYLSSSHKLLENVVCTQDIKVYKVYK